MIKQQGLTLKVQELDNVPRFLQHAYANILTGITLEERIYVAFDQIVQKYEYLISFAGF